MSIISDFLGGKSKEMSQLFIGLKSSWEVRNVWNAKPTGLEQKETAEATKKIFEIADLNKDGKISFDEFSKAIKQSKGTEMGVIQNVSKYLRSFAEGARTIKK